MLGTKISMEILVKIHYFSIEIEKSIRIQKVSINLNLDQEVPTWKLPSRQNQDISNVETKILKVSRSRQIETPNQKKSIKFNTVIIL
jgi:hypothetical protein